MIESKTSMTDKVSMKVGKGFSDSIFKSGNVVFELFGPDGKLKDRREVKNLVTVLGHQMSADQILASPTVVTPGWIELGTGTGQGAGDSVLAAHIVGSRTALDSKTRGANAIVTMVCTFPAGTGTGAVTEAGTFNVVTQNTTDMIMYSSFSVINKGAGDSLVVTWTLTFA